MNIGNALVFGGTGMLAKTTCWITEHASQTIVLGRSQERLNRIRNKCNSYGLEIRELDYKDTRALKREIKSAYEQGGPIDMLSPGFIALHRKLSQQSNNKYLSYKASSGLSFT